MKSPESLIWLSNPVSIKYLKIICSADYLIYILGKCSTVVAFEGLSSCNTETTITTPKHTFSLHFTRADDGHVFETKLIYLNLIEF